MHKSELILQEVERLLKSELIGTVIDKPAGAIDESELPAYVVAFNSDDYQSELFNGTVESQLSISVLCYFKRGNARQDFSEARDAAETVLNCTVDGLAKKVTPQGARFIGDDVEGDTHYSSYSIDFLIDYSYRN